MPRDVAVDRRLTEKTHLRFLDERSPDSDGQPIGAFRLTLRLADVGVSVHHRQDLRHV